jgi:peptide/nickel transport system permease protein
MSKYEPLPTGTNEAPAQIGGLKRMMGVFMRRKITLFGLVIIIMTMLLAAFAPWIAPYNPYKPDFSNILAQPSLKHLLGTDNLGRDTLSRIIYGARTSLIVGFAATGLAAIVGMILGLIAAYFGGVIYIVIMRFIDATMAFPMIVLALVIAALLGGGLGNVVTAISISLVSIYARLMCGQALAIKENEYIIAARSIGSSDFRIMFNHIAPNCLPPLIVTVTIMIGNSILSEAGLSFLGVGINPPGAAWGAMVNDGYNYILKIPILSIAPGLAIMLVVFAFNMVGDGLRDALDPRLRGLV